MRISGINTYYTSFGKIKKSANEKSTKPSRFDGSKDVKVDFVGGYQPNDHVGDAPNPPVGGSVIARPGEVSFDHDVLPECPEGCSYVREKIDFVGGYQPNDHVGDAPNPPTSGSVAVHRGAARFDRDALPEYPEDCSFVERDIDYVGGYQPKEPTGGIPNPPTSGSIAVKK